MYFRKIEPTILYFGIPVALITTLDNNDRANIGPMSSVWDPLIYNFRHYFGLGAELGKTFKAEI